MADEEIEPEEGSVRSGMNRPSPQEIVGEQIRIRREAISLTLKDCAKRCQISESYLADIENGIADPRTGLLIRIAEVLGGKFVAGMTFPKTPHPSFP